MRYALAFVLLLAAPAWAQSDELAQLSDGANCQAFIPSAALQDVHRGEATIAFRVLADGTVAEPAVKSSSGYGELDEAARACVSARHYRPALRQGEAVDSDLVDKVSIATPRLHMCLMRGAMWKKVAPLKGVTRVKFVIDDSGRTDQASVANSSGVTDLDAASLACMKYWRYLPAIKDGKAVAVPWEADIAWNMNGPTERLTDMTKCVRDTKLTPQDMAAVKGPSVVSYTVTDGTIFDLKLAQPSGNKRLDSLALRCASKTRFRETVVIGASPGFTTSETVNWKAEPRPAP